MQSKFKLNETTGNYTVNRVVTKEDIFSMAFSIAESSLSRQEFTTVDASSDYIRAMLMNETKEIFGVVFMCSKHRLIKAENMFFGTINSATVYPREVLKRSLELGAAAVILYHNHPSGHPEPSQADIHITQRLRTALELVDVKVLDHIVVGKAGHVSFAQRGLL
jgi:DNA repair protein RadC